MGTMINLNQLRAFYYVARHASYTAAAEKLCISQPAVTAQVKLFENYYDMKLFRRQGREVGLTHVGKILFEKNGIYHDISSKFVFSNNVKQALLWIENGEVDAAVIYHTDFLVAHNINEIYSSFQVGNEKIEYPIALTSRGLKSSVAIQFRDFILSNTGQNIIESFGFLSFDHHD